MPFTFKLSQRLARMRCAALLLSTAVFAACEKPVASVSGPAQPGTQVVKVVVLPDAITILPSQSKQFAAFGRTEADDSVAVAVTWSASAGSISASGLYTASATPGSATITAMSEGHSGTALVSVTANAPEQVSDLAVVGTTSSSVTLSFTEVDDGIGAPASYDIRFAPSPISWGSSATSVTSGTCTTPVVGSAIGAKRTCTVLGLAAATAYGFQLVAFRGALNQGAVFGELSNVATATTAASTAPVASVTVSPAAPSIQVGQTVQLTATLKDAGGNVLTGRAVIWSTDASGVATVSGSGLVTGGSAGTAAITAMSEGQSGTAQVSVMSSGGGGGAGQVTYYRTNFTDGTTGPLDVYAYGGGACEKSTVYREPGSAYSMKCTIPGGTGAAALQAWFGSGRLAGLPKDPSLDQDVFQQVRFVLGPGAVAALGGTTCTAQNNGVQFKVHKSVYGQAGSAWNGWAMSNLNPCGDGPGIATIPEMWNINGTAYRWPNGGSLIDGTVYDVVYRYHRYTAQNCGTVAVWVNGTKVMDSPCWSYMGTTNGSALGLLFWDGATYLQNALGPFSVYTLFTQATNYPIGAATASSR